LAGPSIIDPSRPSPITGKKYGYTADDFPVSYEWGEGTITLPLFPSLTTEEQQYVIDTVRDVLVPMT